MSDRQPNEAETLERALQGPIRLTFADANEATAWVYRAQNHIRRHAPHLRSLTISRRGPVVRVRILTFRIEEDHNG